jgi:glycine oxidase
MVTILGGGVCGLGVGWRLAQAGCPVTVIERGRAGRAASWAAAGMLAPWVEAEPGEQPLLPLLLASMALWPAFAAELEAASQQPVDYRAEGTLVVALDRDDADRLRHQYRFQRELGAGLELLTAAALREREPHLRPAAAAIFSPNDHQVDNRKLVAALREAFLRAGGVLREQTPVEEIVVGGGRVRGLRVAGALEEVQTLVLAAGSWSRGIPGLPEPARPPVRPLKGQMLAVQMPAGAPLIEHVVWGPGAYLVPRRDGRLLIGATVEEQGFNADLTAGAMMDLLRSAWELLPGIYELPIVEQWAGFRPASRDDAPILGPTEVEGLVMATGHHRNGILLAPITAQAVAQHILEGGMPPVAARFTMARFSAQHPAL